MKWDAERLAEWEDVERAKLRLVPPVADGPVVYTPRTVPAEKPVTVATAREQAGRPATAKQSPVTELVTLAEELFDFGRDGDRAFAVPKDGPYFARFVGGAEFRGGLCAAHFDRTGRAPTQQAARDAVGILAAKVQRLDPVRLHLRVAGHDGAVVVDLGDATGRAVVIRPGGPWEVVDRPPVLFRRTALTSALPTPMRVPAPSGAVPGAGLVALRRLLNVSDENWSLLVAWMVCALRSDVPVPVVALTGEAGAAKSTAAKLVGGLVDPTHAELLPPPADVTRWIDRAKAARLVTIDNLSKIPDWLSDALCRAVTGEGDARRSLYSDDDLTVSSFRRCVVLTGLDFGAIRGDLAERMLHVELDRIADDRRRSDAEVAATYARDRPMMLGALYDLTAAVLATLPHVDQTTAPRMVDFYRTALAVDQVTGTAAAPAFLRAAKEERAELALSDPFVLEVRSFVARQPGHAWEGTAAELQPLLGVPSSSISEDGRWPRSARNLSVWLRRAVGELRAVGVQVVMSKSNGVRRIALRMDAEAVAAMRDHEL